MNNSPEDISDGVLGKAQEEENDRSRTNNRNPGSSSSSNIIGDDDTNGGNNNNSNNDNDIDFTFDPDRVLLLKPQKAAECPLFCVFYAEFDNIVGPTVRFQAPEGFMDHDIGITTDEIHQILRKSFNEKEPPLVPDIPQQQKQQQQQQQKMQETPLVKPNSLSIFDSTCEYIITGNELAGQTISLSTHNMHIIARPTTIRNDCYERNTLLFSMGFLIRRQRDPTPFRPLLSKLISTFRAMELESSFLSNSNTRPQIQSMLDAILKSLNSRSRKCHMSLDESNVLHLQYFPPPRIHAPPVPDHVVPVLLRPEHQLQSLDWDLTIGWIVPHINGIKYAKLIAESSKVDAEVVRVCLRVLRHHNALACVDIFRYSNVYQSTVLAQRMLAGEEKSLLMDAFHFVVKQVGGGGGGGGVPATGTATGSKSSHGSPGGSGIAGITTTTPGGGGNSLLQNKMVVTSRIHPSPTSPIGGRKLIPPQTLTPSSYPPSSSSVFRTKGTSNTANNATNSNVNDNRRTTTHQASSYSSAQLHQQPPPLNTFSSLNIIPTHTTSTPVSDGPCCASTTPSTVTAAIHAAQRIRQEENRSLVKAVAILYASCRRGATLGDILLSKVKESMQNSAGNGNSSSSSGGGETEKKENDHNDKNNSNNPNNNEEDMDLTTNEGGYPDETTTTNATTTAKAAAKRIRKGKQRTLSVSSAASLLPPPPQGNTNDSETIDWKEVFECLDHRRFATFGVIHGLIQRVHQYPISCNVGLDSSSSTSEGVEAGGGGLKRRDDVVVEDDVVDSGKVLLVEDNMQEHDSGGGIVVEEGRRKKEDRKMMRLPTILQPQHSKSNTSLSRNFVGTSVGGLYHNTPSLVPLETKVKDEGASGKAGSTGVPSVTGSMSNQVGGVGNEHQLHDQMQKLSLQVAASMDGTKCDDELCCMYQKPLPQLVELVKKYTRREVISLYSTSQDHV